MAEIFGTAAAALSVAALFNNCVENFEYVQLGRHFAQDYESYQLKLNVAQARLSRWGKAVAMNNDPRTATASPTDDDTRLVRGILEQMGLMFQSVQKMSKRYELAAEPNDLILLRSEDLNTNVQNLHRHLGSTVRRRQEQIGLFKKATWALYDVKQYDKLVDQITGFIDDLETIWPAEAARRHLAEIEIEEVDDAPALNTLQDAATDIDSMMKEVTAQSIAAKNRAGKVSIQDDANVRIGPEFAQNYSGSIGGKDETNSADIIDARGRGRIHIGATYGGRSIFDD
ncbi:hypothetical protein KJ359_003561 [Pestalotiopsis sp. 9143b]|nr:hypothetical protein KJ359_003561 [Pestalotiopsis sp. 9143b]